MIDLFRRPAVAEETAGQKRETNVTALYFAYAVIAAIALGVVVRGYQVLSSDFPLNDGGMFFTMVRDLQANDFRLPAFTSYNQADIPFAYPPLALYIAAALDKITPFGLSFWFRALPLLFSCLTLVAVYELAKTTLRSRVAIVASVLAFALIPRSFIWLIMGGGLTRALGMALAIFALQQVYLLYTKQDQRYLIPAVLLSAGTVLSHLETGWFLAFSIAVFWLIHGRNIAGVFNSGLLVFGTVVLTAPWWVTVIGQHGLGPFLDAKSTGGTFLSDAGTRDLAFQSVARAVSTSEPYFPVIGALGLLGGLAALATRRFLLPAWWLAIVLFDVRAFATYSSVPVALLAGIAISEAIVPLLQRAAHQSDDAIPSNGATPVQPVTAAIAPFGMHWGGIALLACLVYYTAAGLFLRDPGAAEGTSLKSLQPAERATMHWVAQSTPASARFLVIPLSSWQTDKHAEWFPTIAQRVNLTTVQGSEWLPDNAFGQRIAVHDYAWTCASRTVSCLDEFAANTGTYFDYVYVPSSDAIPCCSALVSSLETNINYTKVYDNGGGMVFKREAGSGVVAGPQLSTEDGP